MNKLSLILFLCTLSVSSYSQITDAIYFDKNWKLTNDKNYKFYRLAVVSESGINIYDFYKNGHTKRTATIENNFNQIYSGELTDIKGKATFYDDKGRMEYTVDTEIKPYVEELIPHVNIEKDSLLNLSFYTYYYKNGKIRSMGFLLSDCDQHLKYWYFDRKGNISATVDFQYGMPDGEENWYHNGEVYVTYKNKGGIKNGEYKRLNPFDNILVEQGFFQGGKKHGVFKKYHWSTGKLKTIIEYDKGKKISKILIE